MCVIMLNFSLMVYFLELCFLVALQGNHVQTYIVSHHSMDPYGLSKNKHKIHYMSTILKRNCVELCKICNGIPRYENDICRCHIRTNYPMQCLENLHRKAQILGINLIQRYPMRNKRCIGGNEEMGLPLQFLASTFNPAKSNDEKLGAPSDTFNTFTGVLTAPLFEQIKAVLLGDADTVENTMAGQFVNNLPKALSSFTGILDTFNLASTRIGSGRTSADEDGDESSKSSSNERLGRLIGAYPTIQQIRSTFIGDPYTGEVHNTLPVQLGKAVPKVLMSMLDLFQSLNIGTVSQNSPSSKSWLDEFDDDDDDDNDDEGDYDNNKINKNNDENVVGNTLGQQKIIVSPIKSSTNSLQTDNSGMNLKTIDEALSDAENLVNNPDSQIIQPEEAVIIISPTRLSQTLSKMGLGV